MPRPVNTTIQNRTKSATLSKSHVLPRHHAHDRSVAAFVESFSPSEFADSESRRSLLFSIGMQQLPKSLPKKARDVLDEYRSPIIDVPDVPRKAFDLLGTTYQYLCSKMENLRAGRFFTGPTVADEFVGDLDFSAGQLLLDPACGSGVFLFRSRSAPAQLYGVDSDPLAVMIAKFNYFLKFPDGPKPNLFCVDFFDWCGENQLLFDYVIANPPFGANIETPPLFTSVTSGESFSYFLELGSRLLAPNGKARYLVPDAMLNVKRHTDIRDFLLGRMSVKRLRRYGQRFTGLMSDFHLIEFTHGSTSDILMEGDEPTVVTLEEVRRFKNRTFSYLSRRDLGLVAKAEQAGCNRLDNCSYGLGVVTGNNRTMLSNSPGPGLEPIFTGKEVQPFILRTPKKFIRFDRDRLQQVAPDEIYRTPAKLVYKTISKRLIVALDRTGALTSNSANIIVPPLDGASPESLAAVLNSSFVSFLYLKLFGGVNKIGKEHLLALPIPNMTDAIDDWLSSQVAALVVGEMPPEVDAYISRELYGLSPEEHSYVCDVVREA
jgi:hypothetical protein